MAAVAELRRLSELDPDWQWSRCAIIARNWVDLDPVRNACMVHGIPVQSAREELSSFWRARETQRFLTTLEAGGATTIETAEIRRYRTGLPEDPWAALLAQALEELMLEESHAAVLPTAYVRNWLGEWSKEVRRRQRGLLLTSAHRAKGLEFDHVAILDGRWAATSAAEDSDTPRRLYYVSMTRARETLSLICLEDGDRGGSRDNSLAAGREERASTLLQPLRGAPSVLERQAPSPEIADPRLDVRVAECTMEDVVLSFAGWSPVAGKAHRAIARLEPGDPLSLVCENGHRKILDRGGNQVGRMARKWSPPAGMAIERAEVQGIFTRWAKDEADEERRRRLRCETWEVVVPKLRLARRRLPAAAGPRQEPVAVHPVPG